MASPEDELFQFKAEFNTDNLKDGQYTLVVPVPDELTLRIGRVAIQWGAFELRMDKVIETVLERLYRVEDGWKVLPFKKRKKLFKEVMQDYTAKLFPHETDAFVKIADASADLHWRRNTVVHGYITVHKSDDGSGKPLFTAFGQHNGRKVSVDLEVESLNKLTHDIAHLGGNLMAAVGRMGGKLVTDSPEIVVCDRDFLRDQTHGSFQILPISKPPAPQRQSSPELGQCPPSPKGPLFRRP